MTKIKKTELAVIPGESKLNELIKKSDIELTKAEAHGKAMAVRVNEALAIVKQVIIQDSKTLL